MIQSKLNSNSGFTLLEMVIALGIFVILFTLTLGIYSYALKAEQRTIQMSKLQKEAQLVMETIAKKIRNSRISYDYYGGSLNSPESTLALIDRSGNLIAFKLDSNSNSIAVCTGSECNSQNDFYPIPAGSVEVSELKFYITPASNPFSLNDPPDQYPKITVVMFLQNTQGSIERQLAIQQTIPLRLAGP